MPRSSMPSPAVRALQQPIRRVEPRSLAAYVLLVVLSAGCASATTSSAIASAAPRASMAPQQSVSTPRSVPAAASGPLATQGAGSSDPGDSPSPRTTATASIATSAPTPGPAPAGSCPPVSRAGWNELEVRKLDGGPVQASSVVAWSEGYVAVAADPDSSSVTAWVSRDGRAWAQLPNETFGPALLARAAPAGRDVLIATVNESGETSVWRSADGLSWTKTAGPQMRLGQESDLAGGAAGAIAILQGAQSGLAFSPDGSMWEIQSLPGAVV